MALTEKQRESQRKFRAKVKAMTGHYTCNSQKKAQFKYLNKIRQQKGLSPIVSRKNKISENLDL